MLRKMIGLLSAAVLCAACDDSVEPEPPLDNNALMLSEPEAFDIGMDPDLWRVHLLQVDALDTQGVQLIREVPEKLADGTTRVRLGAVDQDNAYGTYHLNKALGHEGMAISADKKHAYFFPGDVPGGKLVRYRIVDR